MLILLVHNDGSGTDEYANYDYEVRVNHDAIERGRVEGHHRKDDWRTLVKKIIDNQPTKSDEIEDSASTTNFGWERYFYTPKDSKFIIR